VSSRDTDEQVANAILRYLEEAPHAMDTVEGVTEWWLMRQRVRDDVESVERALDALVARGVLQVVGSGSERRYRLSRHD
jgi:Fe2+ or Zn2+ uptake regulation protein